MAVTIIHRGALKVTERYEVALAHLLSAHQRLGPRGHLNRFELVKGDVTRTVPRFLKARPEVTIALAYFDLDLYQPTRACLRAIKPRLTRGSVLVFDEFGLPEFPGETAAVLEELGASRFKVQRDPRCGHQAFVVIE